MNITHEERVMTQRILAAFRAGSLEDALTTPAGLASFTKLEDQGKQAGNLSPEVRKLLEATELGRQALKLHDDTQGGNKA